MQLDLVLLHLVMEELSVLKNVMMEIWSLYKWKILYTWTLFAFDIRFKDVLLYRVCKWKYHLLLQVSLLSLLLSCYPCFVPSRSITSIQRGFHPFPFSGFGLLFKDNPQPVHQLPALSLALPIAPANFSFWVSSSDRSVRDQFQMIDLWRISTI